MLFFSTGNVLEVKISLSGSKCKEFFDKSEFKSRGNCSCTSFDLYNITSNCKPGYGGFMCSIIYQRVCKLGNNTHTILPDCKSTNSDNCFIKSSKSDDYFICNALDGKIIYVILQLNHNFFKYDFSLIRPGTG